MKKFRFPLRPVAVLREHQQARTREAFAAAVHDFVQAEAQLAKKRNEREDLASVMHDGRRETFRPADAASFWDSYRLVCDEEKKCEKAVLDARAAMEQSRQIYLEAHRAVKVVEQLEKKARSQHRSEAERESQKESDELAGMRVARRLADSTVTST